MCLGCRDDTFVACCSLVPRQSLTLVSLVMRFLFPGKLSGGQKQRISIARSLYRNAEILIFDEATSALDNQTEQEVSEAIDSLSEVNKTIFIIAHRVTTLKNCNRIYELTEGKISGVYKYHELLEKVV